MRHAGAVLAAAVTLATARPCAATAAVTAVTSPPPATVDTLQIDVRGLGWTKPEPLKRALDTRPGDRYNPTVLEEDVQRLRDYEIFEAVTATVTEHANGVSVAVTVTDRWGIVPVFRPLSGGGIYSLKLGVRDTNFLGRNQDVAVYAGPYRSNVSTSYLAGVIWLFRQFMGRHGLALQAVRDYGVAALYAPGAAVPETNIEAVVLNAYGEMFYQGHDAWQPGAFLSVSERQYTLLSGTPLVSLPNRALGIRPGLLMRLGQVNYNHYRYEGADLVLSGFHEFRTAGPEGFGGGGLRGRLFLLPHPRLNIALRGVVEARNPHHVLDELSYSGLLHVRGLPNGYMRGSRGVLLNAELRVTVLEALWGWVWGQGVLFYDAGAMGHGSLIDGWDQSAQSVGVGIRGALVKIYGMFLRIDVAKALNDGRLPLDFGLGISQYF